MRRQMMTAPKTRDKSCMARARRKADFLYHPPGPPLPNRRRPIIICSLNSPRFHLASPTNVPHSSCQKRKYAPCPAPQIEKKNG